MCEKNKNSERSIFSQIIADLIVTFCCTVNQFLVNHIQPNDAHAIFLRTSYEFQACCLSPQNHYQGFGFVMKGGVQVFWKDEFLSRSKLTF